MRSFHFAVVDRSEVSFVSDMSELDSVRDSRLTVNVSGIAYIPLNSRLQFIFSDTLTYGYPHSIKRVVHGVATCQRLASDTP